MMDQQVANQISQSVDDLQKIVYIFGMAVGGMMKMQSMIVANKERESEGKTLAYDEAAFAELQDEYQLYHNSILSNIRS